MRVMLTVPHKIITVVSTSVSITKHGQHKKTRVWASQDNPFVE